MGQIMDIMNGIQAQGEAGRQRGLSQLVGKAYTADPAEQQRLLGLVAQRGEPGMAMQAQKGFDDQSSELHKQLAQRAAMVVQLYKANPQMAQQAYSAMLPLAARAGFPQAQAHPQLDDSLIPGLEKLASALQATDAPSGFREFQMTAQAAGLRPGTPEYQQAANIALGREGRASNAGFGFEMIEGADGRKRMGRKNPRTGAFEVYNEQTGAFDPIGGPAQGAPSVQRAPGEVPFSIDPSLPPEVQAAIRANPEAGSAEGITAPIQAGSGALGVSRRPEDEAFAKEQAQQAAQIGFLPQRGVIEAQNAGLKEGATQAVQIAATGPKKEAELAAETRQKALANLPVVMQNSQQTIAVIDKALNHPGLAMAVGLSSKLDPRNLIPGSPGYDFGVVMDQLRGKSFLEAFNTLKGGGQITEVEGKKATDAIARLNTAQSEPEFKAALRELRGIAQMAQTRALAQAQGGAQQALRGGGNVIRYDAQGNRIQ